MNPSAEELKAGWAPVVNRLETLSREWDRPVIVTELGYPSLDGISTGMSMNPAWDTAIDWQEQADLYQAAFEAFAGRDWFRGFFWWKWEALGVPVGPSNGDISPNGKPAEEVIRRFYGAPPRATATPVPEVEPDVVLELYGDRLRDGWSIRDGERAHVTLSGARIAVEGNAIGASLGPQELILHNDLDEDTSRFGWLEFYIYAEDDRSRFDFWPYEAPVSLLLSLRDRTYVPRPLLVDIARSQFIEGGRLEAGKWQRVRVPLDVFGPGFGANIQNIVIQNGWGYDLPRLYFDNISLMTADAVPPTTPTPAPTATPTLVPTPTPTLPPMGAHMQGVQFGAAGGERNYPAIEWALREIIQPTGANWIRFPEWGIQDNYASTSIGQYPWFSTEEDLVHLTQAAHSLGIRVFFEPGPIQMPADPAHGNNDIGKAFDEAGWQAWFESYTRFITRYAAYAEAASVDMFSVGSEMDYAASRRPEDWRRVVAAVRAVYHGPVIYSAENPMGEYWRNITWWDSVDAIGVHPFGVLHMDTRTPSVQDIQAAWAPIVADLEAVSRRWDRPVIITELGYPSMDGAGMVNNPGLFAEIDLQEQADLYRGAFEAFAGRDWFRGFFWFYFDAPKNHTGVFNSDHSWYGKPAEDVLRAQYGGAHRPTPTAIPEPTFTLVEEIYTDGISPDWSYSVDGTGQDVHDQSAVALGTQAIEVSSEDGNGLSIVNMTGKDLSRFRWLEFSILAPQTIFPLPYWPGQIPLRLSVSIVEENQAPRPFIVEITQSQFIEGEKLEANRWQRVTIPLDTFGPAFGDVLRFEINRHTDLYNPSTVFYVDSIRLLGD